MKQDKIKGRIPDSVIEEKAKQLGVKVLAKNSKNGHTYLMIQCLTHVDKPPREVELYNFLNKNKTCGCMLQQYTLEDLKNNKNVRGDLEIIGEYVNNSTPILCRCKICGIKWLISPNKLTQGRGCPTCYANKLSSGERLIFKFLKDNNIIFESQKSFEDCRNPKTKKQLKFDFYLPQYNMCIEFQGKQHYFPVVFRAKKSSTIQTEKEKESKKREKQEEAKRQLIELQFRDGIKKQYCKEKGITLLEIRYDQHKEIEDILRQNIKINSESVETTGPQE